MSNKAPSRVVFVGNIPYGLSEEQISDIFSTAGKVLNFRLVYDRETGRPKGFGFAEYPDADSAASAVRNLNDYEIMGRKLRVDYSSEGKAEEEDGPMPSRPAPTANFSQPANGTSHTANPAGSLPPLPPGKELPPGVTATDAISRTLNTLPPAQLLDILSQMKSLASTDAARATELLAQAPQLSYAIFQALLLMGLVSPEAISSVVDTSAAPPQMPPAVPPVGYPVPPVPGYPAVPTGTPPVAPPYAPPVAPAPPPAGDQDALVKQVLSLPQEVIDQLPEAERQQIMTLRATLMAQMR
ncbi:hinge domain of cleavage stimulation factor subunit 2-domain-containing protein [Microdochium trichocladiopsis]|uniref:Hinge domain of cleavage stimulation factor subunit 2-domain-containing protein n=1 Tax=Microdochium trichocladiopsis TaxID=1682393 RepID=A0A9P8Y2N3_9PEZI|nr:hinge domain of cleavage stimulation factor subunit 2-domain-containing protein [Microdochium trichocladiopsis]KAH7027344.1 hinge domain of cleavage stimulation factor subunit 2-domain-containing protein [Microdochium trichocladiopsis]